MLVTYIKNHRNADRAANNYLEDYPDRQQPNKRYFSKIITNLLQFGAFQKPRPKNYEKQNEERTRNIQEHFNENPTASTRIAGMELNIPKSSVHDVLTKTH